MYFNCRINSGSRIMTDYIVRINNSSPLIEVTAENLFLAAAQAVKQSGALDIKKIVGRPHGARMGFFIFDDSNFQRLADELFRSNPLAEGFEVEESNREGDAFYYIDPGSNAIKLTLDGRATRQTEDLS